MTIYLINKAQTRNFHNNAHVNKREIKLGKLAPNIILV